MDSINRNQPEENRENLSGPPAVAKIRELVGNEQSCFLVTEHARPMNVRHVDDRGNLWFLGANDSNLVAELRANPAVKIYFQGSSSSDFLHLEGRTALSRDKAKIKELWEPILKTWFTGGEDDPRIVVIEFAPTSGYYWDTKHGGMVAGVKMLIGAALGKTLDDSIEGKLNV